MATEKTVAVRLIATVAGYKSALKDASQETRRFGTAVKDTGSSVRTTFNNLSSDQLEKVGRAGLVAGGLVTVGFGLMIKSAMDFDKQMSEVGAVAGATGGDLAALRLAALDAGKATVFSASEAAQAQAELAKAGVSTADILGGGLTGSLDLAAAGSLDLATAAEIAANAMNTFNLEGDDVTHIADLLAAAANKSATDVAEMGMALKQGGGQAQMMGLSVEDTVGTLALFAQYALRGSDGGTSFKTMLQRLVPQSVEAKNMMEELGLEFFNANGEFIGLAGTAEQLKSKLGGLSEEQRATAINTLFGADASRAANALMQEGAAGVEEWTTAVNDSGYAAELAAQKNNNLAGDLEQLRGSIETALIQGGSQATDALRAMTSSITGMVNGLGELPGPIQTAFLGATGLLGVGAAGIGIYGTLAPKLDAFKKALEGLGGIGPSIASNLGKVGLAAAGLGVAMAGVLYVMGKQAEEQAKFDAGVDRFVAAMKEAGGATEKFNREIREGFSESGIGEMLANTDADLEKFTRGVRESGTELDRWSKGLTDDGKLIRLGDALRDAADGGNELATEILRWQEANGKTNSEIEGLVSGMDTLNDQIDTSAQVIDVENQMLGDLEEGAGGAASATGELGEQTSTTGAAFDETAKQIADAVSAMKDWYDQTTSQLSAQLAFEDALDSVSESVKENGTSLDVTNEKGRANVETFISAKDAIVDYGLELFNSTGSAEAAAAGMEMMTGSLAETMRQAGYTEQQIADYLTTLGLTPEQIQTIVSTLGTPQAKADVQGVNTELDRTNQGAFGRVDLDTSSAYGKLTALHQRMIEVANGPRSSMGQGYGYADGGIHEFANGGILETYAAGGIRRGYAGIAPAMSQVLFAETPATGPEAYIPLGPSKRPRSRAIWEETGRRLGMTQAPSGPVDNSVSVTVPVAYTGPDELSLRRAVVSDVLWEMETAR